MVIHSVRNQASVGRHHGFHRVESEWVGDLLSERPAMK